MCPCCGAKTNRFNVDCETCFAALLSGRECTHEDNVRRSVDAQFPIIAKFLAEGES